MENMIRETYYAAVERLRYLFNEEDLMILVVVLACVTLLPIIVFGMKKRSHVRIVAMIVFAIYVFGNLSYTILNREVIYDSSNVLRPLSDFESAFYVDYGVFGLLKLALKEGPKVALQAVHIASRRMAREVLLNVLLYIPLGYLLPFLSKLLRKPSVILLIGFLCSLATEAAQYYFKIGYFQIDDIICNLTGTLIGGLFGILLCAIWRVE